MQQLFTIRYSQDNNGIGNRRNEKKAVHMIAYSLNYLDIKYNLTRLVLEEVLNGFVGNHLLIKDVSTSLGALYHLDNLRVSASILRTFVEGSNGFLCHSFLQLLNLLVKSHLLQDGVILHQLQTLSCVLTILGRNITACAGKTTILHLGALQDNLNAISFCFLACHGLLVSYYFNVFPIHEAFSYSLLQSGVKTYLINQTKASSADLQLNPASLLAIVELLAEQVYVKAALCAVL